MINSGGESEEGTLYFFSGSLIFSDIVVLPWSKLGKLTQYLITGRCWEIFEYSDIVESKFLECKYKLHMFDSY